MKPYEWMTDFTQQREWIEKRGVMLWLAFFFIELGAGMFLLSSLFDSLPGMIIGWLICSVLGGGLHLLYLGKPARFYRVFFRPQSSWISRGFIFVVMFLLLGLAHMGMILWATPAIALLIITGLFAFLTIIYGGFAMNCINGLPFWNTALLPVLYLVSGLWGGAGLTLAVVSAQGLTPVGIIVEEWIRILLVGFILLLLIYLISARYSSRAAEVSVLTMVSGKLSPIFWVGVVLVGIVISVIVVISSFVSEAIPVVLLYAGIFCGLVGDLAMRYLILKGGLYSPLIPSSAYS